MQYGLVYKKNLKILHMPLGIIAVCLLPHQLAVINWETRRVIALLREHLFPFPPLHLEDPLKN